MVALYGLLAACTATPAPRPVVASRPAASPAPTATPSVLPAAQKLVQPAGTRALAGVVRLDANYIVAQGAGNIVASGAGNIVAQGGGNIISGNGSAIISGNGSAVVATGGDQVVAQGGGNILVGGRIVASGAGNIVAQGAGNIVAQGGGNVISGNGSAVISGNGSAIVAQGAGNYRLAQLAVSSARPAFGTALPTVGTVITARAMATGAPLPVGVDGQGKPVYAIYSNLQGEYTLFVPTDVPGGVVVEARVPKRDDPRSVYDIVSGVAKDGVIDEDSALVAKYLRRTFANKFRSVLELLKENRGSENDPFEHPEKLAGFFSGDPSGCKQQGEGEAAINAVVVPPLQELLEAIKRNPKITEADYPILAERLGDVVIGTAVATKDVADFRILPATYNASARELAADDNPYYAAGANAKVLETLVAILAQTREHLTALGLKLGDEAAVTRYFASKPFLAYANAYYRKLHPTAPFPHYEIRRPSDLTDFLVEEYFPLISHSRYGCLTGECPPPPANQDPCASGTAPVASVDPCDLSMGCLPAAGLGSVSNDDIHALAVNVLRDLKASVAEQGVTGLAPLHASNAHVLFAASASLGLNLFDVVASKHCALLSIIARYPEPGEACSD
jgi:hypothetical protein